MMMEVDIGAARPCVLVARFFHRHAHSSKLYSIRNPRACGVPFRRFVFRAPCALSSSLQENAPQNVAGVRKINVKFVLRRRCEFGQQFFVTGDHKLLGEWNPEAAISMQWSEGHVWTLQLDLLSGIQTEFKILLKADGELLEWQPGPNCKLEVSDHSTSLLIFVPWSDQKQSSETAAPQSLEINDPQIIEGASEQPVTEEEICDKKTTTSNSEAVEEERLAGAMEQKDQDFISDQMHWNSITSQDFLSLFPVPDSWYAEEPSNVQANQKFTDPPPGSSEVNTPERSPASELPAMEKDKAGEKFTTLNEKFEVDANDTQEKRKQERGRNELKQTEMIYGRNVGDMFSATESKDIKRDKRIGQEASTQQGLAAVSTEHKEIPMAKSPLLIDKSAQVDEEHMRDANKIAISPDPIDEGIVASPAKNELPGNEFSNIQSNEAASLKPEYTEDKRRQRRGWSKLWDAIVQGRFQ